MIDRVLLRDGFAAACFVGFVGGALWVARSRASGSGMRRATWFTWYVLAVSCAVGVTQRDLYPFTGWGLLAWMAPDSVTLPRFAVVGSDGRVYDVDYRAWQPLGIDEVESWAPDEFLHLDRAGQEQAARWLLEAADAGAARARAGAPVGEAGLLPGPVSAPYFLLHPDTWDDPSRRPPGPLVSLRLYMDTWSPEARSRDSTRVRRVVVYDYPARDHAPR